MRTPRSTIGPLEPHPVSGKRMADLEFCCGQLVAESSTTLILAVLTKETALPLLAAHEPREPFYFPVTAG